jgi:hypothetical protein
MQMSTTIYETYELAGGQLTAYKPVLKNRKENPNIGPSIIGLTELKRLRGIGKLLKLSKSFIG